MSDYDLPEAGTVVIPPLPRSQGGLIQSVKEATIEGIRDALQNTGLSLKEQSVYVGIEYPNDPAQMPGAWVNFAITKLNRAGLGHEITVQDPDTSEWSFIQEWIFTGKITITIAALSSLERDRLADAIIAMIAFARAPELLLTKPQADTKQHRSLLTSLDENPYVGMTLNTDVINPGGPQIAMGTPWKEDILTYEDSYSIDVVGQFNLQFTHDGLYTLSRIDPNWTYESVAPEYRPELWLDAAPVHPVGGGLTNPGGQVNTGNTNIPAM
jgi:hypothetical protein